MTSLPFSEWTREQKDEFAQKRMDEMKVKNERAKQRHLEVQRDRMKAEEKNSSVTSNLNVRKERPNLETEEPVCKIEREWDIGKDINTEDWGPPDLPGFRSKNVQKGYFDKHQERNDGNWRANASSRYNQGFTKNKPFMDHPKNQGNKYGSGGFQKRQMTNRTYTSFHNSRYDEEQREYNNKEVQPSTHFNDSEIEPVKDSPKIDNDKVWRDVGISESEHKQSRVMKWVKSLSTSSSGWDDDNKNIISNQEFYPSKNQDNGGRRQFHDNSFNQDRFPKKSQSFREQGQFKNRRSNAPFQGPSRGRGRRDYYDNRGDSKFDNRANGARKTRFSTESNSSGLMSSCQEKDYQSNEKERFKSDSKSSDYSGENRVSYRYRHNFNNRNFVQEKDGDPSLDPCVEQQDNSGTRSDWDYVFNDENLSDLKKINLRRNAKQGFTEPLPDVDHIQQVFIKPGSQARFDNSENSWGGGASWDVDKNKHKADIRKSYRPHKDVENKTRKTDDLWADTVTTGSDWDDNNKNTSATSNLLADAVSCEQGWDEVHKESDKNNDHFDDVAISNWDTGNIVITKKVPSTAGKTEVVTRKSNRYTKHKPPQGKNRKPQSGFSRKSNKSEQDWGVGTSVFENSKKSKPNCNAEKKIEDEHDWGTNIVLKNSGKKWSGNWGSVDSIDLPGADTNAINNETTISSCEQEEIIDACVGYRTSTASDSEANSNFKNSAILSPNSDCYDDCSADLGCISENNTKKDCLKFNREAKEIQKLPKCLGEITLNEDTNDPYINFEPKVCSSPFGSAKDFNETDDYSEKLQEHASHAGLLSPEIEDYCDTELDDSKCSSKSVDSIRPDGSCDNLESKIAASESEEDQISSRELEVADGDAKSLSISKSLKTDDQCSPVIEDET